MGAIRHYINGACAVTLWLAGPSRANAAEHGTSLEQTMSFLFSSSPAFNTYAVQSREASAEHLQAQGAFDIVTGMGVTGNKALWPGQYGAFLNQGYEDLSAHASLGWLTPNNVSTQLLGGIPLASTIDPATSPDQPQVTANILIPLMKLGQDAGPGGLERAARLHAEGAAALREDQESELVATAAAAYWRWVGSDQALRLARSLETLATDQLRDVDELIEHHARAQVERLPFAAAYDNAAAIRARAEQGVFDARQTLYETLGIASPPGREPPGDVLPDVPASPPDASTLRAYGHQASRARPVLVYLRRELAAAAARVEGARIAKRPDVNLTLQGTVARVDNAVAPSQTQLDYYGVAGLQFAFPLQNRAARGAYDFAANARAEFELAATQRENTIGARIDALSDALANFAHTYARRKSAVAQYQAAYEAERTKFRLSNATALDVVVAEQQYVGASLAAVSDQTDYAVALAQFLHEAGALNPLVQGRDAPNVARRLASSLP